MLLAQGNSQYHDKYKAIFWIKSGTDQEIKSGFIEIANSVNLPEKDAKDINEVVNAVQNWLKIKYGWLLIFDNADSPNVIKTYIPPKAEGHILLTSRAQVFQELGLVKPIEIDEMVPSEALEFLLKRIGREVTDADERAAAEKLVKELGYFPLALEQAGAYIVENHSRFQDYLTAYLKRSQGKRLDLLEKKKPVAGKYFKSVATTWILNFEEVEKTSRVSADILTFSAFLSPDDIPLELIIGGASQLGSTLAAAIKRGHGDPLAIDELLEPLTRYSLIRRNILSQTYSLHQLEQDVIKNGLSKDLRRRWIKRTIRAVNEVFPSTKIANLHLCERLLAQGFAALLLAEKYNLEFEEIYLLLNKVGYYLVDRGRYDESEPLYKRSLAIREKVLGAEHPDVATSLNNLAGLYHNQGKYTEAEPLLKRSLAIREKVLGAEHPDVATSLNNMAVLYREQGKYDEAEPLYKRSLAIHEKVLGAEHPDVATSLNNLAELYDRQDKYAEAEPLYKRSLAILENVLGAEHPNARIVLKNYAYLLQKTNRVDEAAKLKGRVDAVLKTIDLKSEDDV